MSLLISRPRVCPKCPEELSFQIAPVLTRPLCCDSYHSTAFTSRFPRAPLLTHTASSLNFLSWTSFSAVLTSTFSSIHASSINLSHSFISLNISGSVSITLNLEKIPLLEHIWVSGGNWIKLFWLSSKAWSHLPPLLVRTFSSFEVIVFQPVSPPPSPQQQEPYRCHIGAGYSSFFSVWGCQRKSLNKTQNIDTSRLLNNSLFVKLLLGLIHLPNSNQSSIK